MNSDYFTENISFSINFHLNLLAQKVKLYVKDSNLFFGKIANLLSLSDDVILCTIDAVGLYPNIHYEKELIVIRKALNTRQDQAISKDFLIGLADYVLKNNIFEQKSYRKTQHSATFKLYI